MLFSASQCLRRRARFLYSYSFACLPLRSFVFNNILALFREFEGATLVVAQAATRAAPTVCWPEGQRYGATQCHFVADYLSLFRPRLAPASFRFVSAKCAHFAPFRLCFALTCAQNAHNLQHLKK